MTTIDARTVERDAVIAADLCIVGAGAAGIAIARELANTAVSVCLLESGGFEPEAQTQKLYEGESTGTFLSEASYLSNSRARYFGGTTNRWAGWCRPLDAIDFEPRRWVRHSGWPFPKSHLDPYYRRAADVLQITSFDDAEDGAASLPGEPLFEAGSPIATKLFYFSPPTRFGEVYREDLVSAPNVSLFTHANVVDIRSDDAASQVRGVDVACLDGNRFRVDARAVVLATGGVENARLLLLADSAAPRGLGNAHDRVGRFFADHPHVTAGRMVVSDPDQSMALYDFQEDAARGHRVLGVLSLTEEVRRAEELLNLRIYLRPLPRQKIRGSTAAVGQAAAHLDAFARERETGAGRLTRGGPAHYVMEVQCETTPNPESRVTLSEERDALGLRRPRLDWRVEAEDNLSVRRSVEIIARELGRSVRGRASLALTDEVPWPRTWGGCHHMGTTRMHADPREGVVDATCQVHGVAGLFVAGSSVFPNAGAANPTLTVVALALRLADHLAEWLGS